MGTELGGWSTDTRGCGEWEGCQVGKGVMGDGKGCLGGGWWGVGAAMPLPLHSYALCSQTLTLAELDMDIIW